MNGSESKRAKFANTRSSGASPMDVDETKQTGDQNHHNKNNTTTTAAGGAGGGSQANGGGAQQVGDSTGAGAGLHATKAGAGVAGVVGGATATATATGSSKGSGVAPAPMASATAAASVSPSKKVVEVGPDGQTVELPLEVGTQLRCLWRDKAFHPVRIIERKKKQILESDDEEEPEEEDKQNQNTTTTGTGTGDDKDKDKDKDKEESAGSGSSGVPEAYKAAVLKASLEDTYEYYVHYDEFNRRLDEWVSTDKLDLSSIREPHQKGKGKDKGKGGKSGNAGDGKTASGRPSGRQKRRKDPLGNLGGNNSNILGPHGHAGHGHGDGHEGEGHEEFSAGALKEHEEFTKVKNIQFIELGKYEMETWYFSPFPPEYNHCSRLYFCEFDFAFFRTKKQLQRHMKKMNMLHPPGDEIYRNTYKTRQGKDVTLSFFEVDGKKEKIFCQNLCYLAKLFLDHKTLFYDVDFFLFYILCEVDERGCHPVGYFSKEKHSEEGYNLACILMFPSHQRKGYGKLLISFSYELTKKEHKVGTPERPLSDLGAVSYYSYWTYTILNVLKTYKEDCISVKDIADITAITQQDVISTLQRVEMIQYQKGQHVICAAPELLERHIKGAGNFRYLVDPCKLIWTPYQHTQEYAR